MSQIPFHVDTFDECVALPYQVYNALFQTLPFEDILDAQAQLPLFAKLCADGLAKGMTPQEILQAFLQDTLGIEDQEEKQKICLLFCQTVERQILLFDAIEQAGHEALFSQKNANIMDLLQRKLPPGKTVRIVLTAHPTQFYPPYLLSLIQQISDAVGRASLSQMRKLLIQLARTPFRKPSSPTPVEEAQVLLDRFGHILYEEFLSIRRHLGERAPTLELGFWPGGDRDGHPYVTTQVTLQVVEKLRAFALMQLQNKFIQVEQKITCKSSLAQVSKIGEKLREDLYRSSYDLAEDVRNLLLIIDQDEGGLFREVVVSFLEAVELFGFHFASLDLRENSDEIFACVSQLLPEYPSLSHAERLEALESLTLDTSCSHDLLSLLSHVPKMQQANGPKGVHRLIVSHTRKVLDLLEIFTLTKIYANSQLDIVPLFETIEDMRAGQKILEELFAYAPYWEHVVARGRQQTVMLGFSDGTKDGGYVTCNVAIQNCKESLYRLGKEKGIEMIFFDGRGGPPARGGGSVNRYYAMVQEKIPSETIEQTVQGQTISSYYGTRSSCRFNLLGLLMSFVQTPKKFDESLLQKISDIAHASYLSLVNHPHFFLLLEKTTPLTLIGQLNIASRPPKRSSLLSLDSLRAIPFVSAWSLMKINVPAFYGLGTALQTLRLQGNLEALQTYYQESLMFQVLVGNAEMALKKCHMPLNQYLEDFSEYGDLWKTLRQEQQRTVEEIAFLTGRQGLMGQEVVTEKSMALREEIVLPLLVIQQAALMEWQTDADNVFWYKLLLKTIPASINSARNSA